MPPATLRYSVEAEQQIDVLFNHYMALGRVEAIRNLLLALEDAETRIATRPEAGLAAPRPYPDLARLKCRWLKAGRYWIAFTPSVILGVFYETADIPRRL